MVRQESLFALSPDYFDAARVYSSDYTAALECGTTSPANEKLEQLKLEGDDPEEDTRLRRWSCGTCGLKFQTGEEQRTHYKSDFHRLNVKRKLAGKSSYTEEEFEKVAEGDLEIDGDVSSVSGSESESEEDEKERLHKHAGVSKQVPIQLKDGSVVQVWRCLVMHGKEKLDKDDKQTGVVTEEVALSRLKALAASPKVVWVVLLVVGGHFAGVVVDMKTGAVQAHQTYHRYVVRAKAGGKQSTRDATGRAPKSAGASLRRYNELALQKEIRTLLESWATYLREASSIFIFAPSRNSNSLFGEGPLLDRGDTRIRQVPFATRRPTYKEARRVYAQLSVVTYQEKEVEQTFTELDERKPLEGDKEIPQAGTGRKSEKPSKDVEEVEAVHQPPPPPLHEAAIAGKPSLVSQLLEQGQDPCLKYHGKTAYASASDKDTRNAFRRFMAAHPEMWDWNAANVPSPLTDEMEATQAAKQAEKNAKRKAKEKERKKERKAQEKAEQALKAAASVASQQAAEAEAARQRDLRAAAAEARMKGALLVPVAKDSSESCSCCAGSLANKVPFYKHNYKYCSVTCVNEHMRAVEER